MRFTDRVWSGATGRRHEEGTYGTARRPSESHGNDDLGALESVRAIEHSLPRIRPC
jgi:hypothetical protein